MTDDRLVLRDEIADGIAAWDDVAGTRDLWRSMPLDRLAEGIAMILVARGIAPGARAAPGDAVDSQKGLGLVG